MAKPKANFAVAADLMDGWREDVVSGTPPKFFPVGAGEFERVEIGPGLVVLLGGAPGSGKTALSMQWAFDALRISEDLRVLVCNVEMSPTVLLDRQLARLSGVDLKLIRYRRIEAKHAERIDKAIQTLEPLAERLAFVRPPYSMTNVAEAADAFEANLIVIDYIQRVRAHGDHADNRNSVNETMDFLRKFADVGLAVLVVSAVGRTKDSKGRQSYDGNSLNLASFRESSELEFGADSAYIITSDRDGSTLRCLKDRHGETRDIDLEFDGAIQRFTAGKDSPVAKPASAKLKAKVAKLWAGGGKA